MTEADAINLFNELDKQLGGQRPRLAARKVISYIFSQLEDDIVDIEIVPKIENEQL
jgi:hypothetical protein